MTITLRRARSEEADALTDLSMRSKQSNGYDDAFMKACREELTVTEERLAGGEYWVAEADILCGCACLDVQSGEVHAFFVDPGWQRRGIGRLLWKRILERARHHGLTTLVLDADPAAVPFYETLGFETVGTSPSGSIEGRSLPKMARKVGSS